jgi:predicted nucleotidyltransferase
MSSAAGAGANMALKQKEEKAIAFFKAGLAERLPDEQVELLLFGSKARGDDRRGSDVDLVVLLNRETPDVIEKVYRAVTDAALATSVYNISLKPLSRRAFAALKKNRSPFICNVLRDAVPV